MRLVEAFRAVGARVAVTGDGANDAPALAAADVGVAAGGAVDAARVAAAVVVLAGRIGPRALLDALTEGRRSRSNLRHALAFYLGAKAGLIAIFAAALSLPSSILPTPSGGADAEAQLLPLAPVQVIVLELFMDLGASLAFVAEPVEAGAMDVPPPRRPLRKAASKEASAASLGDFFDQSMYLRIVAGGISMFACVAGGYTWGLFVDGSVSGSVVSSPAARAQAYAFACWLIGHVLLALNQRTDAAPALLAKSLFGNTTLLVWLVVVAATAAAVALAPPIQSALSLSGSPNWGIVLGVCIGGTCWMEVVRWGLWAVSQCKPNRRSIKNSKSVDPDSDSAMLPLLSASP